MRKSNPTQANTIIELGARGVFQNYKTPFEGTERKKIAKLIRLRAIGKREPDGATFAQLRFRTIHGDMRTEFVEFSNLLPTNRHEIKNKLADLGYEWPEDEALTRMILKEVSATRPERQFTEREDTATVERKIGGIKGKPRYYAIDVRALRRLAA